MALRVKTVEYSFPISTGNVATAVQRTFTGVTVNIPETNSRTFRSVIMQLSIFDNGTSASTITAVNLGNTITSATSTTTTCSLTNSGEHQSYTFLGDFTAQFQSQFTGTSATVTPSCTITGQATNGASVKFIITYEYEDSPGGTPLTTRLKTVKIPIDSNTGNLTTTLANIGGVAGQIPALDTFLPESTKVYRDVFFETYAHSGTTSNAGTPYNLNMRFDGATTVTTTHRGDLNTDFTIHRIDKLITGTTPVFSTAATTSFLASMTQSGGGGTPTEFPVPCLGGVLVVTYEYDHSASTTILNSLQIPVLDETGFVQGTLLSVTFQGTPDTVTSATHGLLAGDPITFATVVTTTGITVGPTYYVINPTTNTFQVALTPGGGAINLVTDGTGTAYIHMTRFTRTLFIEEPGTISLVQSGVLYSYTGTDAITISSTVGTTPHRSHTHPNALRGACLFHTRRFDSGATGASGVAGITLQRGLNSLIIDAYTTGTTVAATPTGLTGLMFLNYTSGKATAGDGAHAHTTTWANRMYLAVSGTTVTGKGVTYIPAKTPIIPEADYYTSGVGYQLFNYSASTTVAATYPFVFYCEENSNETDRAGWRNLSNLIFSGDGENTQYISWCRARDDFKRSPADPDTTRLDLEATRLYRTENTYNALLPQVYKLLTYHSITYSISSTIQNSSGGLVTVNLHRSDTGELMHIATRTGNGNVTFNWYDDTIPVYLVAIDADGSTAVHSVEFLAGTVSPILDFGVAATYYAYSG